MASPPVVRGKRSKLAPTPYPLIFPTEYSASAPTSPRIPARFTPAMVGSSVYMAFNFPLFTSQIETCSTISAHLKALQKLFK